jgi:hypothetical protein
VSRASRLRLGLLLGVVVAVSAAVWLYLDRPTNHPETGDVVGVVIAVDSQGLGQVRGFTLRLPGGEQQTFSLRALENGTAFPPGHLAEHQATAAPVRVTYRVEGTERLAIRLEDAPSAS